MKKILSIISFAVVSLFIIPSVAKAQNSKVEEQAQALAENIINYTQNKVEDVLNKPLLVVSQEGDTVFKMQIDSMLTESGHSNIVINIPAGNSDSYDEVRMMNYRANIEEGKIMAKIVAVGVIFPCAAAILIVIAIVIFLLVKNRQRNNVIYKAIENNYQLPDSFYRSQKRSDNDSYNAEPQINDESYVPGMPPIPNNLPPTPHQRKEFISGVTFAGIGLFIFLFFLSVRSLSAGLLFGGIFFIIGATRILSFFFLNKR